MVKKRRMLSRILAYLFAVCLLEGVFLPCIFGAAGAKSEYVLSDELYEVIEAVEALERDTQAHYRTMDTFDYTTRYIRSGVYNDFQWAVMVGTLEPAYEQAMQPHAALREVGDLIIMTDEIGERYAVDFPHMAAVCDAKRDFSGWAGDLITLAADITSLHEARLLLGNEFGVFGAKDLRADIDAFNLLAIARKNGGSLSGALKTYYLGGVAEQAVATFVLRETGLTTSQINVEALYHAFSARLAKETCESETLLLENMYGVAGSVRLDYACRAFAEWLYHEYCEEMIGHEKIVVFVYPPTCIQEGYTCVICRYCGRLEREDVVPALSHDFLTEKTEPTETDAGVQKDLCKRCGYSSTTYFDVCGQGDLNFDGKISAQDYMRLKRGILGSCQLTARQERLADINGDGELNQYDYFMFRTWLLNGEPF